MFFGVGNNRLVAWADFLAAAAMGGLALVNPAMRWLGVPAAVAAGLGLLSLAWTRSLERRRPGSAGAPPAPELDARVCPRCLHANQDGWRFCSQCGGTR